MLPVPDSSDLLAWYDRHRRALPWRALPGEVAEPYHVWLSEIMLQQTGVVTVAPYFEKFCRLFPTVFDLAAADSQAVMAAWAGLGYYARARNLHACATAVAAMGGQFPTTLEGLRALPGIGPYTASAIGAIAYGIPVIPVDGNVERVASRIFGIQTPLPAAKPQIAAAAARLGGGAAEQRASDFAQALFDLGATICTPRPACALCPWSGACAAHRLGVAAELPRRAAKAARPTRFGAVFWLADPAGHVLLRLRPPSGLLGGMAELPGTEWRSRPWEPSEMVTYAPAPADWRHRGQVRHVFTHFELHLEIFAATLPARAGEGFWRPKAALSGEALPSVMRKCVALVA